MSLHLLHGNVAPADKISGEPGLALRSVRAGHRVQQGDARGEGRDSNEHVSRGESSAFDRGGGSLLPSTPAVDLLVVANNDQDRVRGVRRGFAKLKHYGVSRL